MLVSSKCFLVSIGVTITKALYILLMEVYGSQPNIQLQMYNRNAYITTILVPHANALQNSNASRSVLQQTHYLLQINSPRVHSRPVRQPHVYQWERLRSSHARRHDRCAQCLISTRSCVNHTHCHLIAGTSLLCASMARHTFPLVYSLDEFGVVVIPNKSPAFFRIFVGFIRSLAVWLFDK